MTLIDKGITVDLKTSAIGYANRGWPVFPVHYPNDGECSCGKPNCKSPAKHPMTPQGLKDATTNVATIDVWWSRWPNANIGIVTGRVSGIVVVDVDAKSGGLETWAELQDIHGRVDTLTAVTGGGGRHFFFAAPPGLDLKSTAGVLGAGIDTRAEGGYIVAPPSLHISGDRYEWET